MARKPSNSIESPYVTKKFTTKPYIPDADNDDKYASSAAWICGFYFEACVLDCFPAMARADGFEVTGNQTLTVQQAKAKDNFENPERLVNLPIEEQYRISEVKFVGGKIREAAVKTTQKYIAMAHQKLRNSSEKTIEITNIANLTTTVLGDIRVSFGGQTIHLELKWQTKPDVSFRYFGPITDDSLFGVDNYFQYLFLHHWKFDISKTKWIKLTRSEWLYDFLQERFNNQGDQEIFRYFLSKGDIDDDLSKVDVVVGFPSN